VADSATVQDVPVVEMRGITKHFPGILANDGVCLDLRKGEILVLLGENGAGKTTLMNLLSGLYAPDSGEILIHGRPVEFHAPSDAIQAGIGVVHQHFCLVDVFSVAENVALSLPQRGFRLDLSTIEQEFTDLGRRYGWEVNPQALIWQLCVGEQQRVEILKALYRGAEVLVLDEPTAVLSPQEAEELARTLQEIKSAGRSVIYISHKLKEVMDVADRIVVLRGGRNVATVRKADTSERELTRLMVGREVPELQTTGKAEYGQVMLDVEDLYALGDIHDDRKLPAVAGFSIQVRAGEIVGLAGVSGNGQRELTEAIAGLRRVESGRVRLAGQDIANRQPEDISASGLSLIPEDRMGTGLVPTLGVADNAILKSYRQPPIARRGIFNLKAVHSLAQQLVRDFSIQVSNLDEPIWKLSGGNLQRLLLAREISLKPRVLVAVHPTRGLDVQATAEIHRLLLEQRRDNAAILLISEDLDEILALSDTIAVMHSGRVAGRVSRDEARIEELGMMMTGCHPKEAAA
jgi:general nucleoside transport system ATP-binding protein